jgi:uncharacterized protein YecT (DUF1311 family)
MISFLAIATGVTLATRNAPPRQSCPDSVTTQEVAECIYKQLSTAKADRQRYTEAILNRLKSDGASEHYPGDWQERAAAFQTAEKLWDQYAEAQCGAVFEYWKRGTVRVVYEADCYLFHTRLRTHMIWREWLTYADRTSPILPEPTVPIY